MSVAKILDQDLLQIADVSLYLLPVLFCLHKFASAAQARNESKQVVRVLVGSMTFIVAVVQIFDRREKTATLIFLILTILFHIADLALSLFVRCNKPLSSRKKQVR